LLLVGKLVRAKIRLFQRLFLPASIIGGFIGLAVGPYGLGELGAQLVPADTLASSSRRTPWLTRKRRNASLTRIGARQSGWTNELATGVTFRRRKRRKTDL